MPVASPLGAAVADGALLQRLHSALDAVAARVPAHRGRAFQARAAGQYVALLQACRVAMPSMVAAPASISDNNGHPRHRVT
jgi:hypothetical protein